MRSTNTVVKLINIVGGKIEELTPLSPAKTEDYEIMHLAKVGIIGE